ncbi:MAG: alpha/beta hydrolase [Myxococcales bacterium]|nr:alpha/beta hydrolase [Myxococcales bacterium]MDD9968628.1 alpha/beta hydrolase [Myxococcales bacterium]
MSGPKLHPQAQAVLDAHRAAGETPLTLDAFRREAAKRPPLPGPDLRSADYEVHGAGGGKFAVRVYWPDGTGPFPALVYLHGGGFVVGSVETHDGFCRTLAAELGCVVASIGYRLAPEHRFPIPVADAYTGLSWVHESADEINVDHTRLAVGGDSAGANLATVTARQAKERRGPPLNFQVLYYPVTDLRALDTPSYREFGKQGSFLTRAEMSWLRDQYLADAAQRNDPSVSPLVATNLIGLPPTYLVTAECDPLRDEGEAYAAALSASGVQTTAERFAGQLHGFVRMYDRIDAGRAVIARTAELMRPALGLGA